MGRSGDSSCRSSYRSPNTYTICLTAEVAVVTVREDEGVDAAVDVVGRVEDGLVTVMVDFDGGDAVIFALSDVIMEEIFALSFVAFVIVCALEIISEMGFFVGLAAEHKS